eukprot:1107003-Rhodomonas_salina.4
MLQKGLALSRRNRCRNHLEWDGLEVERDKLTATDAVSQHPHQHCASSAPSIAQKMPVRSERLGAGIDWKHQRPVSNDSGTY